MPKTNQRRIEMEPGTQNATEKQLETPKTGMQKFLNGFMNFLAMGGILVVIVVIAGIAILISYLAK
jgi:hypothetical protein